MNRERIDEEELVEYLYLIVKYLPSLSCLSWARCVVHSLEGAYSTSGITRTITS